MRAVEVRLPNSHSRLLEPDWNCSRFTLGTLGRLCFRLKVVRILSKEKRNFPRWEGAPLVPFRFGTRSGKLAMVEAVRRGILDICELVSCSWTGSPLAYTSGECVSHGDLFQEGVREGRGLLSDWCGSSHLPLRGKLGWMTPRTGQKKTGNGTHSWGFPFPSGSPRSFYNFHASGLIVPFVE